MTTLANPAQKPKTPLLSNRLYDALKWVAQILLPAAGTFYFTLGELWHLPNVAQTVGTITAFDVFLGVLLSVATKKYNQSDAKYDGTIEVSETEDGIKQAALVLHNYENPADVVNQQEALFKINPVRAPGNDSEL